MIKAVKFTLVSFVFSVLLFECDSHPKITVNIEQIQDRNGVLYEVNQEKAYSGEVIAYWGTGQKQYEFRVKDGALNGKYISYYENGQKEAEYNYKDNKLNGNIIRWYENGQKSSEDIEYIDGKLTGKRIVWYQNGKQKCEFNCKDGLINGGVIEWDENGNKSVSMEMNGTSCK